MLAKPRTLPARAGAGVSLRIVSQELANGQTRRHHRAARCNRKRVVGYGETALRLARYFGTSPQFWLGLQSDYDLDVAADELGERLEREVQVRAKAS